MSGARPTRRHPFAEPLALFACTVAGLVASLLGSGAVRWIGVAAVALPLVSILRHGRRGRRPVPADPSEQGRDEGR